jgi:hypothetical protein
MFNTLVQGSFLEATGSSQGASRAPSVAAVNPLSKFVLVLAVLSVTVVLLTPAPDELPCTAGHKVLLNLTLSGTATALVLAKSSALDVLAAGKAHLFETAEVLHRTCALLC